MRSYLTRFNAAAATVDKPDLSLILMVAISEVVSKTDFKFSLERDPPMDLVEFYLEAERYPRGGLPEAGYGKDKAK